MFEKHELGRVVREAWIEWAKTQFKFNESWLVPYDQLSKTEQEADDRIGKAVSVHVMQRAWVDRQKVRVEAMKNILAGCAENEIPLNGKQIDIIFEAFHYTREEADLVAGEMLGWRAERQRSNAE